MASKVHHAATNPPAAEPNTTLFSGFARSADRFGDRPALEVGGQTLTYAELGDQAARIGAAIRERAPEDSPPLTGILAARSSTAFAGALGALLAGNGYVPLNPRLPIHRCREMLLSAGCRTLVVDAAAAGQLDALLTGIDEPPAVIAPDEASERLALSIDPINPQMDAIAYLLFTSGSTGKPKGVGVAHRNVVPFVDVIASRYGIEEHDRFSQTFDMTFDPSVFDMFVAWERGACVCCPAEHELMAPGRFIRESALTIWFSVPSIGAFMRRLGMLKPGSYPTLRWSLFAGEPLPGELARAWAEAAPASTVENLYGPTETVVVGTAHRYDPGDPHEEVNGVVPIGGPIGDMRALVVDTDLQEVDPGSDGELLMAGPQVTPGYWEDAARTAESFVIPPGQEDIHYRTGDRVRRPKESSEPLSFLGRLDHQIKVLGHRVELGEVEAALREESGVDAVIAIGWPPSDSGSAGIVAFIGDPGVDTAALRSALAMRLPDYMVPRGFELLDELPLDANGKFDRKALLALLAPEPEPE